MDDLKLPRVSAWITEMNNDTASTKKATATVLIEDIVYINGINVYSGPGGMYITLPRHSVTGKDGNPMLKETVQSGSHKARMAIHKAVILAYENSLALIGKDKSESACV